MFSGENIMAVAVVNSSVQAVEVLFPGSNDEIWYRIDTKPKYPGGYRGGHIENVEVDISSVRKVYI